MKIERDFRPHLSFFICGTAVDVQVLKIKIDLWLRIHKFPQLVLEFKEREYKTDLFS